VNQATNVREIIHIMGLLTVLLEKIDHLRDEDGIGRSDPFVKFQLEQDKLLFDKGYGEKVSTTKRNDLNPEYNEVFEFDQIPSLKNMKLSVSIMDSDIGFDQRLGHCEIQLEDLDIKPDFGKTVSKTVEHKKGLFQRDAVIHLKFSFRE
jgi:Ca2+-dependent lipid-binding protein